VKVFTDHDSLKFKVANVPKDVGDVLVLNIKDRGDFEAGT
jgi:hypothetical protein